MNDHLGAEHGLRKIVADALRFWRKQERRQERIQLAQERIRLAAWLEFRARSGDLAEGDAETMRKAAKLLRSRF